MQLTRSMRKSWERGKAVRKDKTGRKVVVVVVVWVGDRDRDKASWKGLQLCQFVFLILVGLEYVGCRVV